MNCALWREILRSYAYRVFRASEHKANLAAHDDTALSTNGFVRVHNRSQPLTVSAVVTHSRTWEMIPARRI